MATQNCPRCGSGRVRLGYRPTPIWWKALFRYNLLCDSCNWEFRGFAVPGTVSTKPPTKKRKKTRENNKAAGENKSETLKTVKENNKPNNRSSNQKSEKRVRIKL